MKIICTQENLKNGLQIASRIISSSNTLPILNNLLLKTDQGQLKISGTNLEMGITTTIRCKVEEEGTICLPAKTLTDLVNNLPNENITLETRESEVIITTPFYHTVLKSLPSEEFPLIPSVDKQYSFTLPAQDLKLALGQVSFSASTSETQPEIAGILIRKEGDGIKFVATDRYRLAEKKVSLKTQEFKDVIIPQRTVGELVRIIGVSDGAIELVFNDNQLAVVFNETLLVSRLVDGHYPDYQKIIPAEFSTVVIADRQALINALKTTGIFSYTTHSVSLSYVTSEQGLKISATSHDIGESMVQVPAEIDGPEGVIILNYRYVLDFLNTATAGQVIIKLVNDSTAVVFTPHKQMDYLYLVMPIKS